MRRSLRPAEQKLWSALRKLELPGGHFRRQSVFGPYILDFVHHGARLVIEVDGGVHRLAEVAARDVERENWLRGRGYVVWRVSDQDAYSDSTTVVQRIASLLGADTPTPTPPRKGEGLRIGEE